MGRWLMVEPFDMGAMTATGFLFWSGLLSQALNGPPPPTHPDPDGQISV